MLTICRRKVGVISPKKIGGQKALYIFSVFWQYGIYLLNKRLYRQLARALESIRASYIIWKFNEFWSTNGLNRPEFLLTLRKFCIQLHCQALNTRGKSTILCQMEGGKWCWWEVNKVAPHSDCKFVCGRHIWHRCFIQPWMTFCLSVHHTCALWQNEMMHCGILIPHERAITLLLWHQQRLVGDTPSIWNLRSK